MQHRLYDGLNRAAFVDVLGMVFVWVALVEVYWERGSLVTTQTCRSKWGHTRARMPGKAMPSLGARTDMTL